MPQPLLTDRIYVPGVETSMLSFTLPFDQEFPFDSLDVNSKLAPAQSTEPEDKICGWTTPGIDKTSTVSLANPQKFETNRI